MQREQRGSCDVKVGLEEFGLRLLEDILSSGNWSRICKRVGFDSYVELDYSHI
jgi:hypothetical protein